MNLQAHDVETLVPTWVERLGLGHWKLTIKWDDIEDGYAQCLYEDSYDDADITLARRLLERGSYFAEWTLVHELLHLTFRDLDVATKAAHEGLTPEAQRLADARYAHEAEGVIDRIAASLVAVAHQRTGRIVHGDATCS